MILDQNYYIFFDIFSISALNWFMNCFINSWNMFSLLSLMSGLAALDAKCSSRLGIMTISYYLWTTFVAVVVGIVLVITIHPGGAAQKEDSEDSGKPIMSSADALLDLIR